MWHDRSEAQDASVAVDSDSVAAEVVQKSVTNLMVSVNAGPKNMRNYAYTGSIADTIGALPQGFGTAKFENMAAFLPPPIQVTLPMACATTKRAMPR